MLPVAFFTTKSKYNTIKYKIKSKFYLAFNSATYIRTLREVENQKNWKNANKVLTKPFNRSIIKTVQRVITLLYYASDYLFGIN